MLHGKLGEHGISEELIAWLEDVVPDKVPPSNCTIEDVRYLQGQRHVVNLIKTTYDVSTQTEDFSGDSIQILTKVKKELAEEALIVAGDLNLRWNDPEDRSLLESFKKDLGLIDPLKGVQAEKGWQILDYILYRNGKSTNLEVLKKGEDLTFQKNLKPLSDHPALYIKLLID